MRWTLALLALLAAGCLTTTPTTVTVTTNGGTTSSGTSTSIGSQPSGIPAPYDRFTSNVQVNIDGDTVVLISDSLPDHKSAYWPTSDSRYEAYNNQNFHPNPSHIATNKVTYRIPLHPAPATTHQQTPLGPIGIAVNGVPFFNQYAAQRQPLGQEIVSFDQGNGHPQQQNQYHYHVEPTKLTDRLGRDAFLGVLLDGYPVYGPVKDGQTLVSSDLDTYHGLTAVTPESPNGTYQYRFTADAPYLNGVGFYGTPGTVTMG